MQKKISVIIGAYNAGPFIRRCIDSIIPQRDFSLDDIEIVLCNDGSTDDTLDIMNEYLELYPNVVKVDSHKNMKPAKTKNRGINKSTGKYLVFLDADDWLEKDYCAKFYHYIEKYDVDVVFGGYKRISEDGKLLKTGSPPLYDYAKYMFVVSTMRIHRRSFIIKNDIFFTENAYGEDILFTVKQLAARANFLPIVYNGYNYLYNTGSITNTTQKGLDEANIKTAINLVEQITKIGRPINKQSEFKYYLVRTVVFHLLYAGKHSSKRQFMNAYKQLFKILQKHVPEVDKIGYVFYSPKGENFNVRVIIASVLLFRRLGMMPLFAKTYCR